MEHTMSAESRSGEYVPISRDGKEGHFMEGSDQSMLDNGAGTRSTPDENKLSIVLDEARDEGWEESRLSAEIETSAVRAAKLAFTLPRELVDHIVDLFDGYYYEGGWRRMRGTEDLQSWSLVCLDWARRCRRLLHKNVYITSRESALQFRALVMGPCSDRLTPLLDLIGRLSVETDPKTGAWPWLHLLATIAPAVPADKFGMLWINGASEVHPRFGSSIHWGVPSAVSALPAPYRKLFLSRLHFASLQSLLRLIRSFPHVEELDFYGLTWDEDGTRAPVGNVPPGNVTPGRQPRATLTCAKFWSCQDATPLLLHTLSPGLTPLQAIPPEEQRIMVRLVEGFNAVNTADGHGMFRDCRFQPSAHTSSETGITNGWLQLRAGRHSMYLSFHYRQTVIGCTALISRNEDESNTSLNAFASHHLWRSLAHFADLRYLTVGLSDVDAVQILAKTHQELWESLGKRLDYHRFASQPKAVWGEEWVGLDPVSLEQTDEKWDHYEYVGRSLAD